MRQPLTALPANRRDDNMRNETLQDINQSINSLPALEERRLRLLERIDGSRVQIKNFKAIFDTKAGKVEKIERSNLSGAIQRILGQYNKNLAKETTDMHAARLNYEKEREHLKDLEEENEDLLQRITSLQQKRTVMQDEIQRREKEISTNSNHDLFANYRKIAEEIAVASKQLVENDEALKAAQKVLGSAKASLEELGNAEQWTTAEMWGGSGLVSRTTKLSKIDHAQSTFNRLSTQMVDLERELSDVHLTEKAILSTISAANHMVEFWFDNILSSQDVAAVLRSNQTQLRVLITQIKLLVEKLGKNEEELTTNVALLEQEKDNLIVTCHSCQSEDGEEAVCKIEPK